jgi:hypothetical protein
MSKSESSAGQERAERRCTSAEKVGHSKARFAETGQLLTWGTRYIVDAEADISQVRRMG